MSERVGDKFYVAKEKDGKCEYCNKVAELRPYGKNGANICFECGMKNIETTEKMFSKRIEGVKEIVLVDRDKLN